MDRIRESLSRLGKMASAALARINERLGGIPLLLKRTIDSYNAHDGFFVGAAMAYYFFFALFPLILALIVIGSYFLGTQQARQATVRLISAAVPVLQSAVVASIDQVLAQRGTITILATLGFIYAASGLFGVMLVVVNRAWHSEGRRSLPVQQALAVALVVVFALFYFLYFAATTAFAAAGASAARFLGLSPATLATLFAGISVLASFIISAALFLVLYWKLPAARVEFADAWPAAVATAVAWELIRTFFTWYLSRFTRFNLVYGSFAAIIGFLTWLYLTGYIIQLGAELSAQIANRRGRGPESG